MSSNTISNLVPIVDFSCRDGKLWAATLLDCRLQVIPFDSTTDFTYVVDLVGESIGLVSIQDNRKPLVVDLNTTRKNIGRSDLLIRAIGHKSKVVIDSTAGIGKDAMQIVMSGRQVVMIERDPVVSLLLKDGLRRISKQPFADRITLLCGDSIDFLGKITADAVYLDPMFEKTHKSALPGRDLQYLRDLLETDQDLVQLVTYARDKYRRVVVKRAAKGPAIMEDVTQVFMGKTVRYDVYINSNSKSAVKVE